MSLTAQSERKVTRREEPDYPELAKKMNLHGTVKLKIWISPDGTVRRLEYIGGHPVLAESALKALKGWHYEAASKESNIIVELKFWALARTWALQDDPAQANRYLENHDPLGRLESVAVSKLASKESVAELVRMLKTVRQNNPEARLTSEDGIKLRADGQEGLSAGFARIWLALCSRSYGHALGNYSFALQLLSWRW
jgi:TonB family protein